MLVLDDDPDFCNFVTIVLSEIGVEVKSINNSAALFPTLEEYHPSLLILDIVLPKYDGLDLLKTIRQDVSYDNLIVVIVTSNEETTTRLSAYAAKADDIMYKPLDIAVLQARVQSLASLHKPTAEPSPKGETTGLLNLKTLITQLNQNIEFPPAIPHYLVVFEINKFTEWLMKKGSTAVNELLQYINSHIEHEYDTSMQSFSYSIAKYASELKRRTQASLKRRCSTSSLTWRKTGLKRISHLIVQSYRSKRNSARREIPACR